MDSIFALEVPWFWDWTANAWSAVAAWATFGVAVLAAGFARHQVLEARQTREEQAQPFVIVDFELSAADDTLMNLIIRNTGTTIAKDVTVEFNPPLQTTMTGPNSEYDIARASIIREGIPTLPPGKTHTMLFDSMPERFNSDLPRVYEATVSFQGPRNQPYDKLTYRLDLAIYFGLANVRIYSSHHAAKALMDMAKTMKKWTTNFDGVRVYTRDEDAILEDRSRQVDEWRREQRDSNTSPDVDDPEESNAG